MQCPECNHPNVDGARYCAKCGALLPPPKVEGADPLIGTIIGGDFQVTGLLGEGGMGRVYTAQQQMGTSVRKIAIKTLLPEFSADPAVEQRFRRECGTVSELEHPNTIKFYRFGKTDAGELYIAMEFVDGKSLADAILAGPLAPERVDHIMKQVCGSLQEAHSKGIVHRDLKPENIILTNRAGETDFVKVLDFGIAKRSEASDQAREQKLTQAGMVLGTPPYMSPEQFMGKQLDNRSDIYSLGVMAYEMLTGQLPFKANTPWEWATQHMTAQPFPFEQTSPMAAQFPPHVKQAIMRALSKDASQRQASAKQFYEELSGGPGVRAGASLGGGPTAPGGGATVAFSPASAPGGTQTGDPYAPAAGTAPGYGSGPVPMGPPMAAPMGPPMAAPTTGGAQVIPPPPPMTRADGGGGNKGLMIVLAGLVAAGLVVLVIFLVTRKSGGDDDSVAIPLPSGTADTAATTAPPATTTTPTTSGSAAATAATPVTTPGTTKTKVEPKEKSPDDWCTEAISAAAAKNCGAARTAMGKCGGARRNTAQLNVNKYCKR